MFPCLENQMELGSAQVESSTDISHWGLSLKPIPGMPVSGGDHPGLASSEVACIHNVGATDRYRISSMILTNEFSGATFPATSIDRPDKVAM